MVALMPETDWQTLGDVPLPVWQRELARVNSPLLVTVERCALAARPHGALCLAQLWVESQYGTTGRLVAHHNPLGLRPGPGIGYPTVTLPDAGTFLVFPDDPAAIAEWQRRITSADYKGGVYQRQATLAAYVATYAPAGDGANDPAAYTTSVIERLGAYQIMAGSAGQEGPTMAQSPVIEDIRDDATAAKYGLTPAQRDVLLGRMFPGRAGGRPTFIVLHIQEGVTRGSLPYWVSDPANVQASSTVTVQADGSILKVIAESDGPWTNGDVQSPTAEAAGLLALGGNANRWSLTLEAEGRPNDVMPAAELDAIVWQVRDWMGRYSIPLANVLPHAAINSVTRSFCGLYVGAVRAAIAGTASFASADVPAFIKARDWDGSDRQLGASTVYACRRLFTAAKDGVPVLQYADKSAKPLRSPLRRGESFMADYVVRAADGGLYALTSYGSRVPLADCTPAVSVG